MGLIFLFVFITLSIPTIVFFATSCKHYRLENALAAFITFSSVFTLLSSFIAGFSYDSYLDNTSFYTTVVEQYRDAINMYEDKAIIRLDKVKDTLTDFRYEGYQESIAAMIETLRDKVAHYNKVFVEKRILNDNWFFSWLIINNNENTKLIRLSDGNGN